MKKRKRRIRVSLITTVPSPAAVCILDHEQLVFLFSISLCAQTKNSHHEQKIQTSRAKTRLEAGPPQGFSPSKEITSFAAITCQQSIITASYQSKVAQHTNRPPYRHRLPTARRGRAQHQSTQPNANATKPAETYLQCHHRATAPTSSCCSRCFSSALKKRKGESPAMVCE